MGVSHVQFNYFREHNTANLPRDDLAYLYDQFGILLKLLPTEWSKNQEMVLAKGEIKTTKNIDQTQHSI